MKLYIITIFFSLICHNALAKISCESIGQQGAWLRAGEIKLEHLGLFKASYGDYYLSDIILPFEDKNILVKAESFAKKWLEDKRIHLKLADNRPDRYGRCSAFIMDAKKIKEGMKSTLQVALLQAGFGFASPEWWRVRKPQIRDIFLNAEQEARQHKKGIWQDFQIVSSDNAMQNIGRFSIIEGKVKYVAEIKEHLFLNFGEDWRTDFTVFIASSKKENILKNIDKDNLVGQKLQVRGVIYERNGASISVRHPYQIMIQTK